MAIYHLLVRPFSVPRFLCGMKATRGPLTRRLAVGLTASGVALIGMVVAGITPASEAAPERIASPFGRWYAEGGAAQVEIIECEEGLCGRVASLRSPFDENGCELRDALNPEPQHRSRPLLGLEILKAQPSGSNRQEWSGTIYDPGSGRTYRCSIRPDGADRLQLRGYIGVPLIGRTTTWVRVGREGPACREGAQRTASALTREGR